MNIILDQVLPAGWYSIHEAGESILLKDYKKQPS